MKKLIPIAVATALLLTACGNGNYAATQIPPVPSPPVAAPATPAPENCKGIDPLASYAPDGPLPDPNGPMPAGTWMATIKKRGRLIAGVSADSLQPRFPGPDHRSDRGLRHRHDLRGRGRDLRHRTGEPHKVELRVISSPAADPVAGDTKNPVDIVARNMTINCVRWEQIAFSAEYYRSGQKTLVQRDSTATKVEDLSDKTICAPAGSTSLENLKKANPKVKPVTADTDTGCLVLFQQGKADGISGDDTVLAGDVAQDPYAQGAA